MPDDHEHTPSDQPNPVRPAQDDAVAPVPAPGDADSSAGPGARSPQGGNPEHGVHAAKTLEGSDSSSSSAGAWTALAAPGKPDGEVDTRS